MPNLSLRPRFTAPQLAAATTFNTDNAGRLFDPARLPEPLRSWSPASETFACMVFADQFYAGLGVDGKLGENTLSLYPQARISPAPEGAPPLGQEALVGAIARARSALGLGVRYRLGKGGFKKSQPSRPRPDDGGFCDCSGLVSWVIRVQRDPSNAMGDWLETTRMVSDATGAQRLLVAIPNAVPGCLVAYPDVGGHEGHTGVVTSLAPFTGVDCSFSQDGIRERAFGFFVKRSDHVFMVPRDWLA